jgi:D-beta-D-heptose 7-phosphate kinase/D-beta-D-heptose 1-phosphate adenosyltransferase
MQSILDRISGLRGVIIGDLMIDHYVVGEAHRLSPEAPVPVVLAQKDTWTLGGAANVARNLRTFGPLTEVIGLIGKDALGDKLQNLLAESNIIFDAEFRDDKVITISKTRIMAARQQICRVDRELAAEEYALTKKYVERVETALAPADFLIFSDFAKGTLTQDVVDNLCKLARKQNSFIAADPKPTHAVRFSNIDLLTPNAREALVIADMDQYAPPNSVNWSDVCKKIYAKHSPKYIVITLGADGMLTARNGQISQKIPTCAREVFDVSGAGDTVIAALSSSLAAGIELEKAVQFANIAAGIVVGKLGTAIATPSEILNASRQISTAQ